METHGFQIMPDTFSKFGTQLHEQLEEMHRQMQMLNWQSMVQLPRYGVRRGGKQFTEMLRFRSLVFGLKDAAKTEAYFRLYNEVPKRRYIAVTTQKRDYQWHSVPAPASPKIDPLTCKSCASLLTPPGTGPKWTSFSPSPALWTMETTRRV